MIGVSNATMSLMHAHTSTCSKNDLRARRVTCPCILARTSANDGNQPFNMRCAHISTDFDATHAQLELEEVRQQLHCNPDLARAHMRIADMTAENERLEVRGACSRVFLCMQVL